MVALFRLNRIYCFVFCLTKQTFNESYCAYVYLKFYRYIGKKSTINKIDERLMQIKLPDYFTRSPQSITQRQYWKGDQVYIHACTVELK